MTTRTASDMQRLAAIEKELDAWKDELMEQADGLERTFKEHRDKLKKRQSRKKKTYRPLMLTVRKRGNSLEISWNSFHRRGPNGQERKNGKPWVQPVPREAKTKGGGYATEVLVGRSHQDEMPLVLALEQKAREIRQSHADMMAVRRGLTTVKLRWRKRLGTD